MGAAPYFHQSTGGGEFSVYFLECPLQSRPFKIVKDHRFTAGAPRDAPSVVHSGARRLPPSLG